MVKCGGLRKQKVEQVQNGKRANPFGHRKLKRKIGGGGFIKM